MSILKNLTDVSNAASFTSTNAPVPQFIQIGTVVDVKDANLLGRIQVRLQGPPTIGGDNTIPNGELAYAFPMMPKAFSAPPKIGEAVFIFVFGEDRKLADRMYMGPIISSLDKLNYDDRYSTALKAFTFSSISPSDNPNNIPEIQGVFPQNNNDDVIVQGRFNTDITQKNNEIIIRAGKFETSNLKENPYKIKFNTKTQAYIQIKNDVVISPMKSQTQEKGTVTNIVANKINLITHANGSPRFDVTNNVDLISSDELARIMAPEKENGAHRLPFGDVVLQYLILMKEALFYHVHNGSGNAPTDLTVSGNKQALQLFKEKANALEKSMLSDNIRIN